MRTAKLNDVILIYRSKQYGTSISSRTSLNSPTTRVPEHYEMAVLSVNQHCVLDIFHSTIPRTTELYLSTSPIAPHRKAPRVRRRRPRQSPAPRRHGRQQQRKKLRPYCALGIEFPSNVQIIARRTTRLILKDASKFRARRSCVVKDKIWNLTNVCWDEGQDVSDDCIVIRVSAPGVQNLKLTDLPVYILVVEDKEDKSIRVKVCNLVQDQTQLSPCLPRQTEAECQQETWNRKLILWHCQPYLTQSRTVILAIHTANADIHTIFGTSPGLKVDPEDAVVNLGINKVKELRLGDI
ncbi:hypothetical protein BJ742DRAFT_894612 [Cladochytrium replicatum]|nr:hypothetical protein BJ742DRAFT_894612 [Cladochytrium replicatum]